MAFVHLHNQSGLSLLDGAMSPTALARRAAELEMPAVALTDTCNLYGAVEFYKACKAAGVQPVFGASIWMWPEGLDAISPRKPDGGWKLVFLVKGGEDAGLADPFTGYRNLSRLITRAIFDGMHYRPRIDWSLLEAHREGLIVLTGGMNGVIDQPDPERARADLARLAELFGDDHLYVELQDYGLPGQRELNDRARALAAELGLATVVTNDCRYLHPEDAVTLDILNAVARGESFDAPDRLGLPTDQQYLKTEAEMRALFDDRLHPGDTAAVDRTAEIAARCRFRFRTDTYWFPATDPPDPDPPRPEGVEPARAPRADTDANWAYFYRAFPPPRDFGLPDPDEAIPPRPEGTGSLVGYFEWYCTRGLELRLRDVPEERHAAYRERLRFEMDVIENMQFPAYLLIVAEFINWAKDHGIPVGPGRGSGAGALVNYAMRITDIDPMRFDLLMERFLNPERVSMPDIDVDFCQDRREEVIAHVRDKYGADLVSQIITYGKLQAKAAIKDVARGLGLDFNAANRIAKLVPEKLGIKLADAIQEEERLRSRVDGDPLVGRVFHLARRVEGMVRSTGVHAAGVIIADRPLVEHAPLYRDGPEGGPVVQFDMKSSESIGLIKFDFLGLKTLDEIRDAVAMVERNTGERVDIGALPLDDGPTFELLQRGDTLGVFQVESSGMRDLLRRLKPSTIDDLIALVALYRPGPLSSGMVDSFIDCKHGRKPITYPHPDLEPILRPTYGSIVYQEQVMQIAQVYAGYTLGGADLLRRAMGKKKAEEMARQKAVFLEGAQKLGRDPKEAEELFDLLAFFAGYGFNKSHSAAYGVIAYQTAWLKAHHRAEMMAALMSVEASNTDKVLAYIGDCRKAGIRVLPPDVNRSLLGFDVPADARDTIRFGLGAIKGVGEGAVLAILEAREAGPFESFLDFLERVDHHRINRKVVESLVKSGAFDWTGHPRRQLFEAIEPAMKAAQRAQEDAASGQASLFGALPRPPVRLRLPDVGEWPTAVKLNMEREAIGFYISGNPVEAYAGLLERLGVATVAGLARQETDSAVRVAGMVASVKRIRTRRGDFMGFVRLEDHTGSVECTFLPDAWTQSQRALTADRPVLVAGRLERGDEGVKVLAESAELLGEVRERRTRAAHLAVGIDDLTRRADGGAGPTGLDRLVELLRASPGSCPVTLHVHLRGRGWASLALPEELRVVVDDALVEGIETLFRRPDALHLA